MSRVASQMPRRSRQARESRAKDPRDDPTSTPPGSSSSCGPYNANAEPGRPNPWTATVCSTTGLPEASTQRTDHAERAGPSKHPYMQGM